MQIFNNFITLESVRETEIQLRKQTNILHISFLRSFHFSFFFFSFILLVRKVSFQSRTIVYSEDAGRPSS